MASDSYTILSVTKPNPTPGNNNITVQANNTTVPMQKTGTPLALAALGLLSILGGAVAGKLR